MERSEGFSDALGSACVQQEGDRHEPDHHGHDRAIHYTVDGEPQESRKHILTARQILVHVGLDPASYYLVQLLCDERKSYKDRPDEPIQLHEHARFVSVYASCTPVS